MRFEFSDKSLDQISADAALLFAFQKEKNKKTEAVPLGDFAALDKLLAGQLSSVCKLEKFEGKKGEMLTVITSKAILPSRIIIIGLGKKEKFTSDDLRRAIGSFIKRMKKKIDSVSLVIPAELRSETDLATLAQMIGEGFLLGLYDFYKYKKQTNEREFSSVIISAKNENDKKVIFAAVRKAENYCKATILARDLVNEPAAEATPAYLGKLAMDIAKANPKQITCKVLDKKEAERIGMGAFLAIAKAADADTPPKFIHLEYKPLKAKANKKIALIGKGITFDSGGMNVKPGDHMQDMKMDMAGAATVLGVFSVIAEVQPEYTVMGLIAATPNLISGKSAVPGDVARAIGGKTIEILNTDAEGRVTLADSIGYAINQGADEIIDYSTLTGAALVALGTDVAALFANNQDLANRLRSAASDAGEKLWELPLEEDYKDLNKSDIADIANIPNTRYAGTITAALFLQEFVEDKAWAHLDFAGPAFLAKASDISQKGGTGYGVRTLLNFLHL